jgi:hypothetical protein
MGGDRFMTPYVSYKRLFPGVRVTLGGIYASLLPEHARMEIDAG